MKTMSVRPAATLRVRRSVQAAANSLFWVTLAFVVFLAYGNLPNRWYHVLYITSGSMAPTIQPGDLIIITPRPAVLKPGMILTLSVNGHLVTHRLVGFGEYGELITQGDANAVPDQWDGSAVGVVGVYRARLPYLGYLALVPGQLARVAASGAWFSAAENIDGTLSAHSFWPPPTGLNLHGYLAAVPVVDGEQHGVELTACLTNTGEGRVEGLGLPIRVGAQDVDGSTRAVLAARLEDSGLTALEPGQERCYQGRFAIEAPLADRYQAVLQVLVPESGAPEGQALMAAAEVTALELTADFAFGPSAAPTPAPTEAMPMPDVPTPAPDTPAPLPTATAPLAPAGASLGALLMDVSAAMLEDGRARVKAQWCVQNTGQAPTEGLALGARVQFNATGEAYVDVLEASQAWNPPNALPPGALECYPIEIDFAPLPGASYQLAAWATITNHAGWRPGEPNCAGPEPCAFGPEARVDFALPISGTGPAPEATADAPADTPMPETALP